MVKNETKYNMLKIKFSSTKIHFNPTSLHHAVLYAKYKPLTGCSVTVIFFKECMFFPYQKF